MPRTILLNPGPVTLSDKVRKALISADWCHREPEFADLTRWINNTLVNVYPSTSQDFQSVILTGSGTSAVEAMLASFAPDNATTLVVANGVYGERMARILKAHGKPHAVVSSNATEPVDLAAVRSSLADNKSIRYVATVHHETTTGRLNDMQELANICADAGAELLVDAVSSFGAEAIDAESWKIAALAATSNKCLHGVPGISFVLARSKLWGDDTMDAGSVYLDLHSYYSSQHGDGYSPYTQSVQAAIALRAALLEFTEGGGWAERRATYRERAANIHAAMRDSGVQPLLPDQVCSCVLRSYRLPQGIRYQELHDELKSNGYVIYAGQGKLAASIFRIANMGDIRPSELDNFGAIAGSFFKSKST
jgi:2-aminoethylphosphonate-pyruvate transaminase